MVAYGYDLYPFLPRKSKTAYTISWLLPCIAFLSGCGGGGGGGASVSPPSLQAPPPVNRIGASELGNSIGLHLVSATSLYEDGITGSGYQIAVLDSGVDAAHIELSGRVIGGGDWQGSTQGLADPNGHGTHVASVAAAARDGSGIQGMAPDAEIVSYRILNNQGIFGAQSGNVMLPPIMADIDRRGVKVVNNSWASFYEITDFSQSIIESALAQELQSYRDVASSDGPILVWAAGNGGENDVSIRSGLPYYFPELEDNWLTVVAVDQNGYETSYTNRCGISAAWCITAPGGGDDEVNNGILGAKSGGGYSLKSGTSISAPLVSGALSLLMEAMPNLSPQAAAIRLKETATYNGLTTASGCTAQNCSEAEMRKVFGHGLLNVSSALQPIGSSSVVADHNQKLPWDRTVITAPAILGSALKDGLKGAIAVINDDFDGAMMLTRLDPTIRSAPREISLLDAHKPAVITAPLPAGLFIAHADTAPVLHDSPAELIDVPSSPTDTWQGWLSKTHKKSQSVMIGQGHKRQAIHFMHHMHHYPQTPYWYGIGLDKTHAWMDGEGHGALRTGDSASQWAFFGLTHYQGPFEFTAEALIGQSELTAQYPSLIKGGKMTYDSLAIRSTYHAKNFDIGFSIKQPPALRDGYVIIDQPTRIRSSSVDHTPVRFNLNLEGREQQHLVFVRLKPEDAMTISFAARYIEHYGHHYGRHDRQMEIQLSKRF